ncbi:hypothetical protein [Armatimonas sp.]|uniref:hypothetical protein n=1 Tax=Armatimonas sp. TaxID=1872638 RepID=UPI00286BD6CC|nr:hypothetical protein [Armatimonas sp.]
MSIYPQNTKPHGLLRFLATYLAFLLVLPLLTGCGGAGAGKPAPVIVVVGDRTVLDVVTELRRAKLNVSEDKAQMASAALIVMAQDSTNGAMPQHRELVQEISKSGNRNILWIMTNAVNLEDPEILALEDSEARDLLYKYNLPGNATKFAIDYESFFVDPKLSYLKGWESITKYIKEVNL